MVEYPYITDDMLESDDPFINAHEYVYDCEICDNKATTEWVCRDTDELLNGDNPIYVSFRCDEHPIKTGEYEPEAI